MRCFNQFSWSYEVTKFWIRREWRHSRERAKHFIPVFLRRFLLILWKKSFLHSFDHFDHLSWTYEVAKFWMIVSRRKWLTCNCGLHVNFWRLRLMPFCFMVRKDHFKQSKSYYFNLRSPLSCLFYVLTVLNFTYDCFC